MFDGTDMRKLLVDNDNKYKTYARVEFFRRLVERA
jgi:hypothetical protein